MELIRGDKYRFQYQDGTPDLMYIGMVTGWHQFTKFSEGRFGKVWSEILDYDLHMIEPVVEKPADKGE